MYLCFVLLWILSLLLMVAATLWLVALSARLWWFLNPLVLLFFGLCLGGAGFFLFWLVIRIEELGEYHHHLEWPVANLFNLGAIAFLGIAIYGNRKVAETSPAERWPLGKLTLVLLGISAMWAGCVGWLYQNANADIVEIDVKALAEIETLFKPQKSADENAAFIYKTAFLVAPPGQLPEEVLEIDRFLSENGRFPDDFIGNNPNIVKHVDAAALLTGTFRNITAVPYYSPKYDRSDVYMGNTIADERVKSISLCLLLEGRVALSRGDTKLALENLLALFRLADQVGQEPTWLEQNHARRLSFIAFQELEHVLANYAADDESLKIFEQWKPTPRWQQLPKVFQHQSLISTHRMCERQSLLRVFSGGSSLDGVAGRAIEVPAKIFFLPSDLKNYQTYTQLGQSSKPMPYYSNGKQIGAISKIRHHGPRGMLFTYVDDSSSENPFQQAALHDAVNQLSLLAVAMHRYRIAKGVFPDSLSELKEMFPDVDIVDPFLGEPFRLLKRSNQRVTLRCGGALSGPSEWGYIRPWSELWKTWGEIDVKLVAAANGSPQNQAPEEAAAVP